VLVEFNRIMKPLKAKFRQNAREMRELEVKMRRADVESRRGKKYVKQLKARLKRQLAYEAEGREWSEDESCT